MRCRWVASRVVVAALALAVAGGVTAQAADSDLSTDVSGPASVAPGGTGTYTVGYANAGPEEAFSAYANLEFPAGVPAPFDQITQAQVDFIEASLVDTNGNVPLLFSAWSCESLLIQDQGPSSTRPDPLDNLPPGGGGTFSVSTGFPMTPPRSAGLVIDQPPSIAGPVTDIGRGSCLDCSDLAGTCFGEPLAMFDLGSRELAIADDGSANPTLGCDPLIGDYRGKVVMIDRGSCEFGLKVLRAETADAAGVVIANTTQCSSLPPSPDCVIAMGAGDFGLLTSIPAAMVSYNQGNAIRAELDAGHAVAVTLGGIPNRQMRFEATIFHADDQDTDPDRSNDDSAVTTRLGADGDVVFADGFEAGSWFHWSDAVGG